MVDQPERQQPDLSNFILIFETGSVAVKAFQALNEDLGLPVVFVDTNFDSALEMLDNGEVAAVLGGAQHTTGEVIRKGIERFNPRRNAQGNIDPKGKRQYISSYFVFERPGDDLHVLSDAAVNEDPTAIELFQIAEQTVENASKLGIEPSVAFLSYSTEGSGHGNSSAKARTAAELFKDKYPAIPTIGEVQFDAATDEDIYELKTGQRYPNGVAPKIWIAPNLDAGNTLYKALQSRKYGGGWTAVGPLLQGFEGNRQLHDLSRGVTPEALTVICKYIAQLSGIFQPGVPEVQHYGKIS